MRQSRLVWIGLVIASAAVVSCSSDGGRGGPAEGPGGAGADRAAPGPAGAKLDPPTVADQSPRDFAGLHNVVAYRDGYYSGSVPEGDAGFDALAALGVRTIISVDGAVPEVDRARARGMRYIHLPIGYNGFDEKRKLELIRASRDAMAEGPVYVHCHHGKHRSAGAAAAVGAGLGWGTPEAMVERMKVSGTAPGYKGLYACAAGTAVYAAAAIDAVPADFPAVAPPEGFVKSMVDIDHMMEHLKDIEKAGWKTPEHHPDLVPAAEAGRLADVLRVLADGDRAAKKPAEFASGLRENGDLAAELERMLVTGEKDTGKLSRQFGLMTASCKECHVKFRD